MNTVWLQARILSTKAIIESVEAAILALSTGTRQSYTLDTGQSRHTVTKKSLPGLHVMLDGLYNQLATLEARCNGAAIQGRPGW